MANTLILPCCREHSQQSVDEEIEKLQGRDASFATPVSNVIVALSVSFGARRTVALS